MRSIEIILRSEAGKGSTRIARF